MKRLAVLAIALTAYFAQAQSIPRAAASDPVPGQRGLFSRLLSPAEPTARQIAWRMEAEAIRLATVQARAEAEARVAKNALIGVQAALGQNTIRAIAVHEVACEGPALHPQFGPAESQELRNLLRSVLAHLEKTPTVRTSSQPMPRE